jgi:hypothetical protein
VLLLLPAKRTRRRAVPPLPTTLIKKLAAISTKKHLLGKRKFGEWQISGRFVAEAQQKTGKKE